MEAAFDSLAAGYDELWTNTTVGQLQREAVWRHAGPLFEGGHRVLDLGCGTGEDALLLAARGVSVAAIDSSPEMVRIARGRGVDAHVLDIGQLSTAGVGFDGALSNFGAMNCVPRLSDIREPLARAIRPGGYLAVCTIGRFCLWETLWYALQGRFRKASRRWGGEAAFGGLTVYYPTVAEMRDAFSPEFSLEAVAGIAICVPPSYVRGLAPGLLRWLGRVDAAIGTWPGFRALSDHRLLVFRRRR